MKPKGLSLPKLWEIVIVAAIVLGLAYFLAVDGGMGGGSEKAELVKWYQSDGTEKVGPNHMGLVKITHTDFTQEGSKVSPGEELTWSGSINWNGLENEDLSSYGRLKIGIYLILVKTDEKELNLILLLGDYTEEMGVPKPPGGQYLDHDGKVIYDLGGEEVSDNQSVNVSLSVTY